MAKTTELRESIVNILSDLTSSEAISIYYGQAPENHTARYIVFSCEELTQIDDRISCELEINCIDYGKNTSQCETLADSIQAAFNHRFYFGTDIAYETYANKRNSVSQSDTNIIWRRLTFDLYLYVKGE